LVCHIQKVVELVLICDVVCLVNLVSAVEMGHHRSVLFSVIEDVSLESIKAHSRVRIAEVKVLVLLGEVIHYLLHLVLRARLVADVPIDHH